MYVLFSVFGIQYSAFGVWSVKRLIESGSILSQGLWYMEYGYIHVNVEFHVEH